MPCGNILSDGHFVLCGGLGGAPTRDIRISDPVLCASELRGHHIGRKGHCNTLPPAPKARAADGAAQGTRWHTSGAPVPWPFDGRARTVFGGTVARPSKEHARIPDATGMRQEINVVDSVTFPLSTVEKL
jgi:hypothetical protein